MALLRDKDTLISGFDEDVAFKLLSDMYISDRKRPLNRSNFSLEGKYIDYNGDLNISEKNRDIKSLELPGFILRNVCGSYSCLICHNLTSLKGAPENVTNSFSCECCENLKSLEGAPLLVGGVFTCTGCNSLTSLEGGPKKAGYFFCGRCEELVSLEGAPEKVSNGFYCTGCKKINKRDIPKLNYTIRWHY